MENTSAAQTTCPTCHLKPANMERHQARHLVVARATAATTPWPATWYVLASS